jgi:putative dimethyl sulfoxide reductase chaperone
MFKRSLFSVELEQLPPNELAVVFRLLGSLFYYQPEDFEHTPFNTYFYNDVETPVPFVNHVLNAFKNSDIRDLQKEYEFLFSATSPFVAPPWGSVYLDTGSVLFGSSTQRYCEFIEHCGLGLRDNAIDPDDHLGLMLMVLAMLIEDEQVEHVKELLGEYLLPWFGFFSRALLNNARSTAYLTLLESVTELFAMLRKTHTIQVLIKDNQFRLDLNQ